MNVELDEKSMGMTCENIDVMGGIMHIKKNQVYETAGALLECFHNRGHRGDLPSKRNQETVMRWNEWQFFQMKLQNGVRDIMARIGRTLQGRFEAQWHVLSSCARRMGTLSTLLRK